MSDGPYRSLPMSLKWKLTAKYAYLPSFSLSEISEALQQAVERDCRVELSSGFVRRVTDLVIGPVEPELFPDITPADLNTLHRECSSPMEHVFLSNAMYALGDGLRGQAALQWAAEASVADRILAGSRQIEEHIHRMASDQCARATRSRLEEAYGGVNRSGVARMLLRAPDAPARTTTVVYSSLDDGVQF